MKFRIAMNRIRRVLPGEARNLLCAAIVSFCCVLSIAAQVNSSRPATQAPAPATSSQNSAADQSPAHKYFTDVVLVNQNGEKMRLYSDLLQGKVVIINSSFAT